MANFASTADLEEKQITFEEIAPNVYAYTAEGDPNSGVIVGPDGVLVMDAQATPVQAQKLIDCIRSVTDKPIKYLVLSHYHAVRVMGASAYNAETIIASKPTYENIVERGQQDFESEVGRFPRLFDNVETVPGLTWPTITFDKEMSIWMGDREVRLMHLGRSHTKGDIVAWLPDCKTCFAGDMVEYGATPYTGDAYLRDWPTTLDNLMALGAEKMIPGRGAALTTPDQVSEAVLGTREFISDLYGTVSDCVAQGKDLTATYAETYARMEPKYNHWVIFEHCMPFDVTRAFQEASGVEHPQIWTADRDREMWAALQAAE
ncbi:MAG: MBL fold metallo-hydrolase [Alphaproteobacteria bacterium]|nr:MBL fold metallo-hydrolase [Alphaproteobacteria bacterium]